MAAAPVKSPLHNFPLPFLRWGGGGGSNNHSRCRRPIAADSADGEAEPSTRTHRAGSRTSRNRLAPCSAEKPKESHNSSGGGPGEEPEAAEQKPWNLRPRKALFAKSGRELHEPEGASAAGTGGALSNHGESGGYNQSQNHHQAKSLRLRGLSESSQPPNQQQQSSEMATDKKRKFWIALSREEIEEDVFIMTGSRPARRPRKRPKNVQKQLDAVFPGLWLVGFTADSYRVAEAPAKR